MAPARANTGLPTQRIECDVLVVGGGPAALIAALEARRSAERVLVACKRKAGRSGNIVVAGPAFSVYVPSEEIADSAEQHLRDTLEGGAGINDPVLARTLVSEAAGAVMGLEQYGILFRRLDGSLVRLNPPGHSRPRSIRPDLTGYAYSTCGLSITLPLLESALKRGIGMLSDTPVHELLVRNGEVCGALALDASSGEGLLLSAKAVVLAAGGGGQLFARTNNTREMTGDSYSLALEAGAALRDMEFAQFHPAYMSSPGHASMDTPLFGAGAVLRNRHGEPFMSRYDPAGDMATRDVMSKAIFLEVQAGNGVDGGVYMDVSPIPLPVLQSKFPSSFGLLRRYGIDPATRWVVVSPATHFIMGGVWIDSRCRTSIPGLFAVGEAAGGVHGANRLGGNALTETAVFGVRAGQEAAAYAQTVSRVPEPEMASAIPETGRGSLSLAEVKARLRQAMWEHASIVRSEGAMRKAWDVLEECSSALTGCRIDTPSDLLARLEVERMVKVGQCIVAAALARKESRGAHFRTDYPERNDALWRGSSRVEKVGERLKVDFVPQ